MKTFPLQSLTLIEAQQKQFALVDTICRHFPGSEFLTCGDLGLTPGLNQPRITQRVEQVLADAFHAQAAALVQGAGTGAIRAALAALLKPGQRLLVHDAPVYPTTRVIIEQMGLTLITADFNDLSVKRRTKNAKAFHDKCENFSFRASNETAVLITAFYSLHGDHLG
ncbi:aminotransferase class I/II-fold pyridoxal phosphate-dependent enzyme, partial [Escherichia coli]|uniref:aminotransferase class I/II-fold pyridoxal phosphate-dependent enzyme n=1 Tax=Escherichia coli TaxID=562 RepID=UPI00207B1C4A